MEGNPRRGRGTVGPSPDKALAACPCAGEARAVVSGRGVRTLTTWSVLELQPYK